MLNELISVIVPVYQSEKFIEKCIRSIILQEDKNFELILVNDGTKDKSIDIAKNLLSKSDIIYRIIDKENGGLSSARNVGIVESKGLYVVFVDSDDILDTCFLSILRKGFTAPNVTASCCNIEPINFLEIDTIRKADILPTHILSNQEIKMDFLMRSRIIHPCSIMIKKKLLIEEKIFFDEKILYSEDQFFIWQVLFSSKFVSYTYSKLYNYIQRENSIMSSSNLEKIMTGFHSIPNLEKVLLNDYPEEKSFIDLVLARWFFGLLRSSSRLIDWKEFSSILNETDYEKHLKKLTVFKDYRVRMINRILLVNPRIGYEILRKV